MNTPREISGRYLALIHPPGARSGGRWAKYILIASAIYARRRAAAAPENTHADYGGQKAGFLG